MSEVTTAETLLAAMQRKEQLATREVEDAQAAMKRAEDEVSITETILSQMRAHKFPAAHIEIVTALMEPEAAMVSACEERQSAAEKQAAAANQAVEMAAKHVQMQSEGAAGAVYGN